MGKRQLVFLGVAMWCCATKVALADPSPSTPSPTTPSPSTPSPSTPSPSTPSPTAQLIADLDIPPEVGYVVETHLPTPSPSPAPFIVHIQEAHVNYEAQQHLIRILEQLVQQHGVKLFLLEGGEGDVSLSYLRAYGPTENRKEVAEQYLKAGILSAEEYLDIVSDYPLILWGVEDQRLYEQNVQAFLETEPLRERLAPLLASLREAMELLKPRLLPSAWQELEGKTRAFDANTLPLADYAAFLAELARSLGLPEEEFPDLARFLEVHRLEQGLAFDQVQPEQRALMERLSARADAAAVDGLLAQARDVKTGTLSHEAFYASLTSLAADAGIELAAYPTLSRYIRYITQRALLKPAALGGSLDALAARLRDRLASTPEQRALRLIDEELGLVERLFELRLSPQEYEQLQAVSLEGLTMRWEQVVNEQLQLQGLPARAFPRLEELEPAVRTLQRFYEAAITRDEALVERALRKLRETQERVAVLITGGFHSPRITQRLKEEGLGVVVVVPTVSHETDERLYEAVLKYKNGYGNFEEVQTAARQAAPGLPGQYTTGQ